MSQSRVLLNASWAEVQSLVDLEAISRGCQVFCTLTGSTYEHSPRQTNVFGAEDLEGLVAASWSLPVDRSDPITLVMKSILGHGRMRRRC